MNEDSITPGYVERKGGGLHPEIDRKWLNMMMMILYFKVLQESSP